MAETSKTILYLTYDGLSDHIGQSQIMPYIIANSKAGFKFHILSFEKSANTEKINKIQETLAANGIIWHRLQFTVGGNMLYKLYDVIKFIFLAFWISVKYKCRIIHSRSYLASSIGLMVKWLTGKKLIFDKRDFWIDAKVETGRLNPDKFSHGIVHKALRFFERRLFLQSTHIVSLTHAAKDIVLARYPQRKPEDISVIPCCADRDLFDPAKVPAAETAAKKQQLGLTGSPVFGYVGSIDPAYFISELLDCFKVIKQSFPNAQMLFLINNGAEQLYELAGQKQIPAGDLVVTSSPRAGMPLHISLFDIGMFYIMPSLGKKATSPTKQYEMLAMGKQIITNKGVGDAERIMNELQCGFLVTEFTDAEYLRVADWLRHASLEPRKFDLSHYSLEYGARSYNNIYRKIFDHVA